MRPNGGARRAGPVRTPFQLVSLGDLSKQGLAPRVESLAVSVDSKELVASIYIGTSDGQVLLFSLALQGGGSSRAGSPTPSTAPSLSNPSTPQSLSSVTSVEEPPSPAFLVASHKLGKTPVDSLCELPAANQIAALCEGHVTLLGKKALDAPVHMAAVQGGALMACDLSPLEESDDLGWLRSMPGDDPEGGEAARVALKSQRRKGLQRLFGGKQRVSDSRTDVSSDDSRQDPVEIRKLQRLVVGTRRKLLIFGVPTERDSDHPVVLLREIVTPEPALRLAWYGPTMILGTRGGYVLMDLRKGEGGNLLFSLPSDSSRPPLLKPLTNVNGAPGELVLFADNLGIVVNPGGQPTGASYLLKAPPETVGHTAKYLLAVAEGQLDVVRRKGGVIVQNLALGGKRGAVLGPSVAADDSGGRCTVVASNARLWWAQPTPLEEQAKELLRQREIDEGVALIEEAVPASSDASLPSLLATVHAEAGFIQFNELHFDSAIDHFLRSSTFEAPELFPFFPTYTAKWRSIVPRKRYWGLHPPPQAIKKVVDNGLFQRQNTLGRLQIGPDSEPTTDPAALIKDAKRSVTRYLATVRSRRQPIPTPSVNAPPAASAAKTSRRGVSMLTLNERGSQGAGVNAPFGGVNALEAQGVDTLLVRLYADVGEVAALEALAREAHACVLDEVEGPLRAAGRFHALALLLETGGQLSRALSVWEALVEGGVQEAEAPMGAVAEEKGRASEESARKEGPGEVVETGESSATAEALREEEAGGLDEEGDFEGPRLLAQVASLSTREFGSFRSSSFRSTVGSPRGTEPMSPRRSSSLFSSGRGTGVRGIPLRSRLSGQAAVGAENAARVLKRTSDMGLVLEHGRWLVRLDPELALAAFTAEERGAPLPADQVLALLRQEDARIWRAYLHWVVEEQGTQDSRLHTELAIALAQAALAKMAETGTDGAESSETEWGRVEGSESGVGLVDDFREGLTEDTGASVSGSPIGGGRKFKNDDTEGNRGTESEARARDVSLEQLSGNGREKKVTSAGAQKTVVSGRSGSAKARDGVGTVSDVRRQLQAFLDESDNYEIGAVLDKIRGSELWREQVILYRRGGDHVAALKVLALKLGDVEGAEQYCAHHGGPDSYANLLEMYLHPGDGRTPMHAAAVRLLHCHGAALDPLKVLEALPPDMPLAAAAETIARLLRERVHRHRQGQIVHHLTRKANFDARLARVQERVRCVELTDERACWACHARIGTKLCALYPNNVLVCYKCLRKAGEHVCPVTGTDFRVMNEER